MQLVVWRCWCLLFEKDILSQVAFLGYQERDPCLAFFLTVRFLERASYSSPSFLATMMLFRCSASRKKPSMGLFLDSQETLLVIKYPFRKAGTNISKQPTG